MTDTLEATSTNGSISRPIFNGFWGGFDHPDTLPTPLNEVPESVNVITLAFAGPIAGNQLTTDYLCKYYDAATIQGWVKQVQSRGQKVLVSIIDNPSYHWADIDIPVFVKQASEVILGDWGLDGVDIDSESTNATQQDFAELLTEFRTALGPLGSGRLLTYDGYISFEDLPVFQMAGGALDWVNLMAYFDPYDDMVELFQTYAAALGPERVVIGVKPGRDGLNQSTPLSEVKQLATYQPDSGKKAGMMLYALTLDLPYYTDQPEWTYTNTIASNLAR